MYLLTDNAHCSALSKVMWFCHKSWLVWHSFKNKLKNLIVAIQHRILCWYVQYSHPLLKSVRFEIGKKKVKYPFCKTTQIAKRHLLKIGWNKVQWVHNYLSSPVPTHKCHKSAQHSNTIYVFSSGRVIVTVEIHIRKKFFKGVNMTTANGPLIPEHTAGFALSCCKI
jgi:hypothetical protein